MRIFDLKACIFLRLVAFYTKQINISLYISVFQAPQVQNKCTTTFVLNNKLITGLIN